MQEIWKDIKNYEGKYQVSNYGQVKSTYKGGRILKPGKQKTAGGYNWKYV